MPIIYYNGKHTRQQGTKDNNGYTTHHQHDNNNGNRRALALQQFQVARMGQDLIWNNSR